MGKIIPIFIVSILVLSGIGVSTVMSCPTLSSQKQLVSQESKNKVKLIFVSIQTHVIEIYGTVEEPQFKPLADVSVEIESSIFGIFWVYEWSGTTNESGTIISCSLGEFMSYKVTIAKDGYHTYECLPFEILYVEMGHFHVYFTMAEDGSPFTQQISQNAQQSNPSSISQQNSQTSNQLLNNLMLSHQKGQADKKTILNIHF
jgi:hypothetical protein